MRRIIIKLSGESLANKSKDLAIDNDIVEKIVGQIKKIIDRKIEVGIVVGGGNFWRGAAAEKHGIPRNRADYIGMLATVMNGLALQSAFQQAKVPTRIQSSIAVDARVAENYINEKAVNALKSGEVLIFVGGTGRPFFTTDTAAALVASELQADTILMGKNGVDGVYDSDPKVNQDARRFETITYAEIINKGLKVMDATAAAMARDNHIKVIVFDITQPDSLIKVTEGKMVSTLIVE
ncbi:UMP kinase [Mycoplasma sp. ATU-Cv-703]|uniref:UMP kinase n=1 Tax=Mycoplasma sp. ATU-Cv-703 TaxID=2498595 RepID=UPI000FDDFECB